MDGDIQRPSRVYTLPDFEPVTTLPALNDKRKHQYDADVEDKSMHLSSHIQASLHVV